MTNDTHTARTHYHAGCNVPGYMPMADEPNIFATFDEAKSYMLEELDRAGDHMFDGGTDEEERGLADEYSAAMEDLNLDSGPGWDAFLPSSTSEHDLGVHYWIVQCSEDCEVDES